MWHTAAVAAVVETSTALQTQPPDQTEAQAVAVVDVNIKQEAPALLGKEIPVERLCKTLLVITLAAAAAAKMPQVETRQTILAEPVATGFNGLMERTMAAAVEAVITPVLLALEVLVVVEQVEREARQHPGLLIQAAVVAALAIADQLRLSPAAQVDREL